MQERREYEEQFIEQSFPMRDGRSRIVAWVSERSKKPSPSCADLLSPDATLDTATYSYLANSPLVSQIVFSHGGTTRMTTTKQFDHLNRLTRIQSGAGVSPVSDFQYAYNSANQRITATVGPDSSHWSYGYDSLGQVTSGKKYWSDATPVAGQHFEYLFDDIGNRVMSKAGNPVTGLRQTDYVPNPLNQYTGRAVDYVGLDLLGLAHASATVSVNGSTSGVSRKGEYFYEELLPTPLGDEFPVWQPVGIVAGLANGTTNASAGEVYVPPQVEYFTHDADGNLTQDGRWVYTWDAENRLVQMDTTSTARNAGVPPLRLRFAYDSQSRRIGKGVLLWTNNAWSSVLWNRFVYDGWNLVAVFDTTNGLAQSFAWGTDASGSMQGAGGIGGLLFMAVQTGINTGNYFYAYDGNYNVAALVDASNSAEAARYEYGPFGEVIRATGPMARVNSFLFSTKYYDWETKFYYYGYRYYDPSTGRWPNRDPIEEGGGYNLCGFVGNNPVSEFDPNGQWYPGFPGKPQLPPLPPIDCSGYSKLGGASCKDCGKVKKDKYPEQAQSFCEGFKKIYTGSSQQRNAACVASCLINAEKGCQSKYQDCERRNCCRLLAHVKCYAQCFFVGPFIPPFDGAPPGAWDFGWNELLPACKSLLPEVPDLPPGWPPYY